jgi:hypothetical protein
VQRFSTEPCIGQKSLGWVLESWTMHWTGDPDQYYPAHSGNWVQEHGRDTRDKTQDILKDYGNTERVGLDEGWTFKKEFKAIVRHVEYLLLPAENRTNIKVNEGNLNNQWEHTGHHDIQSNKMFTKWIVCFRGTMWSWVSHEGRLSFNPALAGRSSSMQKESTNTF